MLQTAQIWIFPFIEHLAEIKRFKYILLMPQDKAGEYYNVIRLCMFTERYGALSFCITVSDSLYRCLLLIRQATVVFDQFGFFTVEIVFFNRFNDIGYLRMLDKIIDRSVEIISKRDKCSNIRLDFIFFVFVYWLLCHPDGISQLHLNYPFSSAAAPHWLQRTPSRSCATAHRWGRGKEGRWLRWRSCFNDQVISYLIRKTRFHSEIGSFCFRVKNIFLLVTQI